MTPAEIDRHLQVLAAQVTQLDQMLGGLMASTIGLGTDLNLAHPGLKPSVVSERFGYDSELVVPTRKLAALYARFPERMDITQPEAVPLRHIASFLSNPGVLATAAAATGYGCEDLTGFIRRNP